MQSSDDNVDDLEDFYPKAANESVSPALARALDGIQSPNQGIDGRSETLEIIIGMMQRGWGATVEEVVTVTGWPVILVERALQTLVEIMPDGESYTLVNATGTKQVFRLLYKDEERR